MKLEIFYGYWIVFGMGLMIAEIFMPSFTIFWFGSGAIVVGGLLFLIPDLPISWQLFLWAVASCFFTYLWFKFLRPLMSDRTKAGISREAILGESGQVIKPPAEKQHGVIRFTTPLLGSDEWPFICDGAVDPGDRVFVKDISGNTLIVEKRIST